MGCAHPGLARGDGSHVLEAGLRMAHPLTRPHRQKMRALCSQGWFETGFISLLSKYL